MEKPIKTKSIYPVTLAEAKRHLRVDESWNKDDDYITSVIEASTEIIEHYIGFDIAQTSTTLKIWNYVGNSFKLDEPNVQSVTVKAQDNSTNLPVDHIESYNNYTNVYLVNDTQQDPLYIEYNSGYSNGTVPNKIKQAILIKVGDLYDMERSSYTNFKDNGTWQKLVDSYKITIF